MVVRNADVLGHGPYRQGRIREPVLHEPHGVPDHSPVRLHRSRLSLPIILGGETHGETEDSLHHAVAGDARSNARLLPLLAQHPIELPYRLELLRRYGDDRRNPSPHEATATDMEVHDRHVGVLVVVYRVQDIGRDHDKVAFTYAVRVPFDVDGEIARQDKVQNELGIDVRPGRQYPLASL